MTARAGRARPLGAMLLCAALGSCGRPAPAPPPLTYRIEDVTFTITFHPVLVDGPPADRGTADEVFVCGERFTSLAAPRLRVWSGRPEDAAAFVGLGEACLAAAERLLGDAELDLTLVATGVLPDLGEVELGAFARATDTAVIALPTDALLTEWTLDRIGEELAEGPRSEVERGSVLRSFAEEPGLRQTARQMADGTVMHEVGHVALLALVRRRVGAHVVARYGTWLPDWIDEVVATAFEPPGYSDRERVRCTVLEQGHPLERYFALVHPHHAGGADAAALRLANATDADATTWFSGSVDLKLTDLTTRHASDAPAQPSSAPREPALPADQLFYAQSRLFGDYLLERSGAEGLRALVEDAIDGVEVESSISSGRAAGLLPATLAELQADWERWLARGG